MSVRLHFTTELFYPHLPGGLMRFFRYGPGLRARGVEPNVVTLRTEESLAELDEANQITIHRLTLPSELEAKPAQVQRRWLVQQALERSERDQSMAHVIQPNVVSHEMSPLLFRAKRKGIPVVFNIAIAPEWRAGRGLVDALKHWLLMKLTFGMVDRMVVLSQTLGRTYTSHCHLRPGQIEVIPNGVDLKRFRPPADEADRMRIRQELNLSLHAPMVLFVGGVMPRKGVDHLLRAWNSVTASVPAAQLVILGSYGPRASHQSHQLSTELTAYMGVIDSLKAGLTHPESVRFVGEVEDPSPWYRAANVFGFPSHREGMPNVVLEAMASGIPSLVTPFEGLPAPGEELGTPGEHFLLLDRDPELWARVMVELLGPGGAARCAEMGATARQWVTATNDLEKSLDRWANLYHSLARRS